MQENENDILKRVRKIEIKTRGLSNESSVLMALLSAATCFETNSTRSASKSIRTSSSVMKIW